MILLKKLDGSDFYLNPMMIEQIIATPDTTVLLNNGKRLLLKDSLDDTIEQINQYWKSIFHLDEKIKLLKEQKEII